MFSESDFAGLPSTLSVGELNRLSRRLLEGAFARVWVAGEIGQIVRAASGHLYFTLKDDSAQVRAALWRSKAAGLAFRPENGQQVEALATATIYEARGEFQLVVDSLRLAGQGALYERFLRLKAKLEAEGLFAAQRKRPIPAFVRQVAIVTSPKAAALRDVLSSFARRAPQVRLSFFPTPVQGEGAAASIARALVAADASGAEAIVLVRGGGSLEDLWAFNEEVVVRAVTACATPVISGVGHETDFTLTDFAADLRAPTPTAAAELAAPEKRALLERLTRQQARLSAAWAQMQCRREEAADRAALRLMPPKRQLAVRHERIDAAHARLTLAFARHQEVARLHLERLARTLESLNPKAVLQRGYAIAFDAEGKAVRSARSLSAGQHLRLVLAQGEAGVVVGE
jgi:exodeoxyribonuclease VII large subunit